MKAFVLVALVALLAATAACGAYEFGGAQPSPSPFDGTVVGRVVAVPCAPVEQQGTACVGRPVSNLEIDYVGGECSPCKTATDTRGMYAISLAPGDYIVKLRTYMRILNGALKISVAAGSNQVANYTLDSGIRMPVPQQ